MRVKNKILKNLLPYLLEHKKKLITLSLIAILGNGLTLIGPYLIGKGINILKFQMSNADFISLGKVTFLLGTVYILGAFLTFIQNITMNRISQQIVWRMRKESFEKLHKFSIKFFDNNSHGNIISIMINDIDNISSSISQIGTQVVVSILTIVITLGIMTYISPTLTLVQIVLVIITGGFLRKLTLKSREKMREQQRYLGELSGYVEEMLMGEVEIKSFTYEENAIQNFKNLNEKYKENAVKAYFFTGFSYPSLNYIGNIGYALIVLIGSIFILNNEITLGGLSSFIIYSRMFNRPIANISDVYSIIQTVFVSAERFFSLVNQEEEKETGNKKVAIEKIKGDIQFIDVTFGYQKDQKIIDNFSFEAKPGNMVAIVGPTGAGKTTIANLLMRFYDIDSGKIIIDGKDIREYSRGELRKLFGMVLQDTWIFTGTIKENIVYGNENVSDEAIINAAKLACAHDFIIKLSQGYDTKISEDNITLSQGQKQLITIARAILRDPRFLILDEATSGVDTRTEMRLQKAMENLIHGRTSFVIAHRLSTIKSANLILVIKDGKIEEQGTHNELMDRKGFYYTMFNEQYIN
ncbi:ABC transporter ATP-binding protein [Cetobacterium somerae]|uniref:ABC transporter ATP-binding protein n=1 Tax=Cetobacterium somerae TaxID=188913 RepID=UPI00211EAEFC|nr:ABC transporter ATP-binding protein [Cetobacterium somerae]MCQ9626759.1 ABC transporter ATP-binding protein [Cetobacterium somerae]